MDMKKYRLLVTIIIAMGIILIGTANPVTNIYKSTNLINKAVSKNKNNTEVEKNLLICIDPGHQEKGDSNPEAVAPGSSQTKARVSSGATGVATKKPEYILNLEASIVLKHILEGKGYRVVMTRETNDVNISNAERARLANEKNADMVIRIHADSLDNSSKTGASVLVPAKESKYTSNIYEKSNKCAQYVQEQMKKSGIEVNGIFERGDLTGFNWSKVPVILVEMGFLSNYNEDQMMSNPDYQRKLMQSIADGVEQYFINPTDKKSNENGL
jgi:N-acetylmuramoyl-L-alanine amidase